MNEDSNTSGKKDYFLEIEEGEIDAHVDQNLEYVLDVKQRRVTFSANGTIWALRFPNDHTYRLFGEELNDAIFYNQYGVNNDDEGRAKMDMSELVMFSKDTDRLFEPMEVDEAGSSSEQRRDAEQTPDRLKERQAKEMADDDDAINGIIMGAGEVRRVGGHRQQVGAWAAACHVVHGVRVTPKLQRGWRFMRVTGRADQEGQAHQESCRLHGATVRHGLQRPRHARGTGAATVNSMPAYLRRVDPRSCAAAKACLCLSRKGPPVLQCAEPCMRM